MTNVSQSKNLLTSGVRGAGIVIASILLISIGFFTLFAHMFAEGFGFIPGDFGDSRLVNLLLEHNYRHFFQFSEPAPGGSFWSPTWMFFPLSDTIAMSETMTGSSWLYAIYRWLDFDYQTSFQLWILSCAALNFVTAAWLFRSVGLSLISAFAGAWVFAFAMPRAGFLIHPQLMPGFFSPLALLALWKYSQTSNPKSEFGFLALFSICAALQIWSCIYLGWFLGFFVGLGSLVLLIKKSTRPLFIGKIRRDWKPILAAGVLLLVLIAPVTLKLLETGRTYGSRKWTDVTMYLPEYFLVLMPHEHSYFHRWLFDLTSQPVKYLYEKLVFPGFVVFFTPILLLRINRKKVGELLSTVPINQTIKWLAPVMVLLMLILTIKIKNTESLWRIPYMIFPGAKGLRTAGRLILLTLLPMGFSFGLLIDFLRSRLPSKTGIAIAILLLGFVILENAVFQPFAFKKADHETSISGLVEWLAQHRNECDAFYYFSNEATPFTHIDATWSSFLTGVPTLNGHSGVTPRAYRHAGLDDATATTDADAQSWIALHTDTTVRNCMLEKNEAGISRR